MFRNEDPLLLFEQALSEMTNLQTTEPVRLLLRQVGIANLWFFGKIICGYAGPYDKWDDDAHMDMANFRQTWLEPGCRKAMALPRRCYKTSICTEAGNAWEIVRDPNIRIRITHKISDIAFSFRQSIRQIFADNELFAWLYPDAVTRGAKAEFIVANRTKYLREPTVDFGGVGGASAGFHYDLHDVDDPHDVNEVGQGFITGAEMEADKRWFWANEQTLLVDTSSRIGLEGTRYADGDILGDIIKKCRKWYGYPLEGIEEGKGSWDVYYRSVVENGKIAFPNAYTQDDLDRMMKDSYWTYATQVANDPSSSGVAEWGDVNVGECELTTNKHGEKVVVLKDFEEILLRDCAVVQSCDPAASETGIGAKTSRTALAVLAEDSQERVFLIDLKVGYVPTTKVFDWLFETWMTYEDYVVKTIVEMQGPFKSWESLIRQEEVRRKKWISLCKTTASGNKHARIRMVLDPLLRNKRLFVRKDLLRSFLEELKVFSPGAMTKMDILDAVSGGVTGLFKPRTSEERWMDEAAAMENQFERNKVTGY